MTAMLTSFRKNRIATPIVPTTCDRAEQVYSGQTQRLGRRALLVRVVSGEAWVTANGEDFVLQRGQEATLPAGAHEALITALGSHPLTYEMCWP